MPTWGGPAKAEHRPEARENQDLIEVMANLRSVVTIEDLVLGHLSLRVHG